MKLQKKSEIIWKELFLAFGQFIFVNYLFQPNKAIIIDVWGTPESKVI